MFTHWKKCIYRVSTLILSVSLLLVQVFSGCVSRVDFFGTLSTVDMVIKQGAECIANGSGRCDFGSIDLFNPVPVTFTIENTGYMPLEITGVSLIWGDFSQYYIDISSMSSKIQPGDSATFRVIFKPTTVGYKTAKVGVVSNSTDEGTYIFSVYGYGNSATLKPDITVKQGAIDLADGTGLLNFGNIGVGLSSSPVIFTVENNGTGDLVINSVVLSSGDTDQFGITTSPASYVAPGSGTTFEITFSPTSAGYKSAVISIDNNDPDENPYVFTIEGNGDTIAVPDI